MKNTKRRLEPLSFFNHTGISRHLEKMAAKGWMIEKIVKLKDKYISMCRESYMPDEMKAMFKDVCDEVMK